MARIYSWQLTDTKYAYITGINNDEPFVGNRLKTEDYEIVTDKVDSMSATQYSANFDKLCVLCNQYGLDPTKEGAVSAMAFYDTTNLNSNFMVVLVGKDGKDGAKGDKGDKGDPGEPGVTPDTPIPYISVTAYNSTGNRDIRPDTPKEGDIIIQWNPNTKQYTFSDKQGEWYLYDSDANDNDGDGSDRSIIWQSSAVYNDKGIVSPWTKPIRITGENGEPGADGNNLEFIYTRRTFPMIDEDAPISVNKNKDVPDGWTGSPTGIDDKWKYEYMCQRRKDANDKWGPWEGPTVWSRWGDDGKDGDGVEYVYYTTNGQEPNFRCEDTIESEAYQKSEYRPIVQLRTGANDTWADVMDNEGNPVKWYDNPRQIDAEDNRAQWVLIRKRRTPEEGGKAQWGQFEGPSLWSMYGEKGDQGIEGLNVYERKLYQSYNANDAPHYIRDTFSQAFPWAPAIPVEKGEGEAIWCIEAYIKLDTKTKEQVLCWYDGSVGEQVVNQETGETDVPHWSVPYIIEGRDGADRVHSEEKIYRCVALGENGELVPPPIPEENHKDEDYCIPSSEGWTQYPIGLSNETPVCYFCYRTRDYREWWGEWSDWEGPFLHTQLGSEGPAGTDGTDGKDGDGVEYVYARTTDGDAPECHIPPGDYDDGTYQEDEYKPYRDADYTLRWSDEPQGVDEVNCYEWVMSRSRTYDETDEVVKWSEFSTPGIFAKYGFNGKDGKDIEYVYALTKTYVKPGVVSYDNEFPNGEGQKDEFYPQIKWSGNTGDVSGDTKNGKMYWMDNAKDVTVDWPYQWEMIRKKTGVPQEDNVNLYDYPWSEYTDDIVTLHSKWGRDGDQGRQGVAGVAGITYEMRYIRARHGVDPTTGLENDDIYLFVPNIVNGEFGAEDNNSNTPIFKEVLYVNEEGVEQDAWKQYWYNTIHPGTSTPLYKTRNLHKDYFPLYTDVLGAEKDYPYMFFIQSRIIEDRVEETWVNPNNNQTEVSGYTSVEILENGEWEAPARLTGKQGIQGPRGNRGPILFSAGVYGMGKKYYTDGVRKPYVLDPADKEYYYLETGNYSPGATVNGVKDDKGMEFWYAYPDGNQHSKDNIPSKDSITDDPHWVKMEQFDVILANVGIFNSALVGSGVFYGDWFYSQNGTINGRPSTEYEKFLDVVYDENNPKYDEKGNLIIEYEEGDFKPTLALNLKDGSGWFANGNISWGADGVLNCNVNGSFSGNGEGSLADGAITWDANGLYIHKDTTFDADVELKWGNISDRNTVETLITTAQNTANAAKNRMDGWVADSVISKLELQGIKDEKAFIIADKNDIDTKCERYSVQNTQEYDDYDTYYTYYLNELNRIINALTGTTESVSVGSLSENQSDYYSSRTQLLEAIVVAEQTAIANGGYSQSEIEAFATTITKNTVTTGFVNALKVTADNVTTNCMNAISAEVGDLVAENIDVTKLNTTGKGVITGGTISIEGNSMKVYKNDSATEILEITGDSSTGDLVTKHIGCANQQTYGPTQTEKNQILFHDMIYNFSGLTKGVTYECSDTVSISVDALVTDYYVTDAPGQDYGSLPTTVVVYKSTTKQSLQDYQNDKLKNIILDGTLDFTYTYKDSGYSGYQNYGGISDSFSFKPFTEYTPTENERIYCMVVTSQVPGTWDGKTGDIQVKLSGGDTISAIPRINKVLINSAGIKLLKNGDNYIKLNHDGTFVAKHGKYSLGLDSGGAYKTNSAGTKSYL